MNLIAHTESVAIDATPAAVMEVIGDPEQLPRWAPQFAREVRREDELWVVTNDSGDQQVRIRVVPELGVVDYLAPNAEAGAYSRVVARGAGAELMFTTFFAANVSDEEREAQRGVIAGELATVRALVEGA